MSRQANVIKSPHNGVTPRRPDEVTTESIGRHRMYVNETAELPAVTCSWFGDGWYAQDYAQRFFIWIASEKSVTSVNPRQELIDLCRKANCNPKRLRYLKLTDARHMFGRVDVA